MTMERRAHPRQGVSRAYLVGLLSPDGRLVGWAVPEEVSAGGIRLLASQCQAAGKVLTLVPERPHPLAGRWLPLQVTRCEQLPGGGHHLAGVFTNPLSDDEARALAGP
jgi:hypothetical protein